MPTTQDDTSALTALRTALTGVPLLGFNTAAWADEAAPRAKAAFVGIIPVYTVTNTNDTGTGSLRDAITQANTDSSDSFIVFAPSLAGQTITLQSTLTLTAGGTSISGDINNDGAPDVTISGNNSVGVFTIDSGPKDSQTSISGLTITRGNSTGTTGNGGNIGTLQSPNGGPGQAGGDAAGGIYVRGGSLSIQDVTFANNTARGGAGGFGGQPAQGGTKGAGGAGGNAAGAVYVTPGATVQASNLIFSGNTATAGIGGPGGTMAGQAGTAAPNSNDQTVRDAAVCFASGTRILTARGAVAVEDLAVGDRAVTASGALRPVTWIGHRVLDGVGAPLPTAQQPIHVRAEAFGPSRPARNLRLSPGHPVLVGADADNEGGVLVPVMCLINGTTVTREAVSAVTYWHVELDSHDILLAEGLPAESYIDGGDRAFFAEGSDHALHNPDFMAPGWNGRCRPVAVSGAVVEAERLRLDAVFAGSMSAQCDWPTIDFALSA